MRFENSLLFKVSSPASFEAKYKINFAISFVLANLFNGTSSSGELSSLLTDKESPLFNRVISGNYPPASTLKPFIGLLALENKIIDWDYSIDDKGFFQIEGEGRKYRGWKEGGHGEVNLKKAIAVSSDVFFYQLATSLTIDRLSNFLEQSIFCRTETLNT